MLTNLVLGNILLLAAILVFTSGFLSSELYPGDELLPSGYGELPSYYEEYATQPGADPPFRRVVFVVIDALRSDFVYGSNSGFNFVQGLIRDGTAIPYTARVAPPTVTLPRIKAATTGSKPGFADVMGNLDQKDASKFASSDSWLRRLRASGARLVFYGDDTWLRLFGSEISNTSVFARFEGVNSFLTSDYTDVDHNVTRHISRELEENDWNAMILHYLGIDHIGHMSGPRAPHMIEKQRQMDDVVKSIMGSIEDSPQHRDTLLILLGDHGMNEAGNHGGDDPGETESALLFASPKFRLDRTKRTYECPTSPKGGTDFHYYDMVEQQDLVPTLSGLLGLPIPRYNIGIVLNELQGLWPDDGSFVHLLEQNAQQLWAVAQMVLDSSVLHAREKAAPELGFETTSCERHRNDLERLACLLSSAEGRAREARRARIDPKWVHAKMAYEAFLKEAQQILISENRPFNAVRMVSGIGLCIVATALCCYSIGASWPWKSSNLVCLWTASAYAYTLWVSTSSKSEQYFWYALTSVWIVNFARRALGQHATPPVRSSMFRAFSMLLGCHCIATYWTLLAPFLEETMFTRQRRIVLLMLSIPYLWNFTRIARVTLTGIMPQTIAISSTIPLTTVAFVFKISQFAGQSHGFGDIAKLDQVTRYRMLLILLAATAMSVCVLVTRPRFTKAATAPQSGVPLLERLQHLLTLFLMTQSRPVNVPVFLLLETQREALRIMTLTRAARQPSGNAHDLRPVYVAVSVLTLSHTYFFCLGGSNSISSIDLRNAYNGVSSYNVATVAVLLFSANWTGPVWWCFAAATLLPSAPLCSGQPSDTVKMDHGAEVARGVCAQDEDDVNMQQCHAKPWLTYLTTMSAFMALLVLVVMILCTIQREDVTVWTLWGSKYLYSVFWVLEWHLVVLLGLSSITRFIGRLR